MQCDGSQGDNCREYEQQFPVTTSRPQIIVYVLVLFLSKVGISQFKLCTIAVDVVFWMDTLTLTTRWILPTVGTDTLSSVDRVSTIGIL